VTTDLRAVLDRAVRRTGQATSDFDLNPDIVLPKGRKLHPAAVLVAVTQDRQVILTKRSSGLRHHPGQIAFPGGRQEKGDAGPEDAALREAEEEIGLGRNRVEIIGRLPGHETVTGFAVTPVLALADGTAALRPEAGEVDEIFRVPLAHLTDTTRFRIEARRWQGRQRSYFTVPYGPYYVWGATARILRGLAEGLRE